MNKISLEKLRLALRYKLAIKASYGGGWFIDRPPFPAPAVQPS
jgi:hypothetical protein